MLDQGDSGGPLVVQAGPGENYDLVLSTSLSCLVAMLGAGGSGELGYRLRGARLSGRVRQVSFTPTPCLFSNSTVKCTG